MPDVPTLQIGAVEGAADYEFADVSGLDILDNGLIAVADAGAAEIRLFDESGRFMRRIGRKGAGPGEFRRLRAVFGIGADSLAAYDEVGYRISVFSMDGTFIRTVELDSVAQDSVFRLDTWLHGRFWIVGARDPERRRTYNAVLDQFVLPDGDYRFAVAAREGRVWVREPLDSARALQQWTVLDAGDAPVAVVSIPGGLDVLQVRGDTVVGRWRDPYTDVSVVRLYRVQITADSIDAPPWARPARTAVARATTGATELRAAIQPLIQAQERYYASNGTYAGVVGDLDWEGPQDVAVQIVAARAIGWSAAFIPAHGNFVCGMGVGFVGPPGWPEGRLVCSSTPTTGLDR